MQQISEGVPLVSAVRRKDLNGVPPAPSEPGLRSAPLIRVDHLEVRLGDALVLDNVTLDIADGEFVCLIGPSGCGKTTLMNAIAGFVPPCCGAVISDGRAISGPGSDRGMVFQEYALFPWLTVEENVQYGPSLSGVTRQKLKEISDHYLSLVRLTDAARLFPKQLSGGMRQRVAIARALANRPRLLLMDEPFGALDAMTREALQEELLKIWDAERRACVFVTHSMAEAVYLADRIVVMRANPGAIHVIIENRLPRPRDRTSAAFFEETRRLNAALGEAIAASSKGRSA